MILLADSGSTKTDWLFHWENNVINVQTKGYNPFHVSTNFIEDDLKTADELIKIKGFVSQVYFYGAGCSSEERNEIVKKALTSFFNNAEITVDHDLKASAHALFGDNKGISAIMGTGSNVCYFDGKNIYNDIPALGFILGDEGGGSNMGKRFMKLYLNKQLPEELNQAFSDYIEMSLNQILDRIYRMDRPNEFLASLVPFLKSHMDYVPVKDCVCQSIEDFFSIYVSHFANRSHSIGIVGSIGMVFSKEIGEYAGKYGFEVSRFLKNPIQELYAYHNSVQ